MTNYITNIDKSNDNKMNYMNTQSSSKSKRSNAAIAMLLSEEEEKEEEEPIASAEASEWHLITRSGEKEPIMYANPLYTVSEIWLGPLPNPGRFSTIVLTPEGEGDENEIVREWEICYNTYINNYYLCNVPGRCAIILQKLKYIREMDEQRRTDNYTRIYNLHEDRILMLIHCLALSC